MATVSSTTASASETVPVLPAPAGRIRPDLGELDDRELLDIVRSLPRSSEQRAAACELLAGRYRNMVWSCVQRYSHRPEPFEDLMQVGYVGLLKAINNFDPAIGRSLAAYAAPCITGEIKRHFRDKRWQVQVKRSVHPPAPALKPWALIGHRSPCGAPGRRGRASAGRTAPRTPCA
jgi:hypothetical protein